MISFKSFVEKETGKTISFDYLYDEVKKKVIEAKLPIDPNRLKPFFSYLKDREKNKRKYDDSLFLKGSNPNQNAVNLPGSVIFGCVLLACTPLPLAIAWACPLAAPFCYGAAEGMCSMGFGLIIQGALEANKKQCHSSWHIVLSTHGDNSFKPDIDKNAEYFSDDLKIPLISVEEMGMSCGNFEILDIQFDSKGKLSSVSSDFIQKCYADCYPMFGAIKHNSFSSQ